MKAIPAKGLPNDRMLTLAEVAQRLGLSVGWVRDNIPHYKFNARTYRIRREDVEAYLANSRVE